MSVYKVSYSMLSEQGEELKKLAKLVDGYMDRVNAIKGKLGNDALLEQVRTNLTKLSAQLGESRAVLSTAGGLLAKTVESYSGSETRQVKKVDSLKAHNRDFYKNPVVVASAGGAAAGAAAAGTVLNYTDNSTTINSYAETGTSAPVSAASAVKPPPISAASAAQTTAKASQTGIAGSAGIAAAAGVAGGVVGAGMVEGALRLKGKKKRQDEHDAPPPSTPQQDDLDARLAKARERARRLNEDDD